MSKQHIKCLNKSRAIVNIKPFLFCIGFCMEPDFLASSIFLKKYEQFLRFFSKKNACIQGGGVGGLLNFQSSPELIFLHYVFTSSLGSYARKNRSHPVLLVLSAPGTISPLSTRQRATISPLSTRQRATISPLSTRYYQSSQHPVLLVLSAPGTISPLSTQHRDPRSLLAPINEIVCFLTTPDSV